MREYAPLVFRTALRTGISPEDAEDVMQSVWVTLLRNGHTIRDPVALPAWLIRTSRWTALRLTRRKETLPLPEDLTDPDPQVDEQVATEEGLAAVRTALARLPERCRTLLSRLFRDERPDYHQVSGELGIPVGSIGPTRARCLAKLERLLEESGE